MPSCLGLYIEENLIKYAKVSKDRDDFKVEAFGIKFYENVGKAIEQIIAETFSYKTPISVNLSEEMYNYFFMFNMLTKNDLQKAIATEFESYCSDNNINENAFESRYILTDSSEDKEKVKIIHVSANKTDINKKNQQLEGYKLSTICSMPISISNLLELKDKENIAIVNMENETTITTIVNDSVNDVTKLDIGAKEVLNKINAKENSYLKAYEICKNTTIYTSEGKELVEDTNEHLEDIMPTLYNIVSDIQKHINEGINKIETVYLTGILSVINNIDLYFQEYLPDVKCEVLKPYFTKQTIGGVNIKEYIEVNSAIALALQGVGAGLKSMNFKKASLSDNINGFLKVDRIGPKKDKENGEKKRSIKGVNLSFDLSGEFDTIERNLIRSLAGTLCIIIVFMVFSFILTSQMKNKNNEANETITDTKNQIALVKADKTKIDAKTTQYTELIDNLNRINEELNEKYRSKDAIPNLLNQIMYIIPKTVQITGIENTSGKHIVIKAQSTKYEDIGYFKAKLKLDGILTSVESDSGVKEGDVVKTTIEGELP